MWQKVEGLKMISFNTIRTTDSLIDEPEFLDATLLSLVASARRKMDYSEAKYVADWGCVEREVIRQAQILLKEKGPVAIFGKHTSFWDRLLGRKHYTRIDVEFDKVKIKVHITPVAV
jgi:hypothetical protein